MSSMRTPLHSVLGLGSAREGTMHFWRQRLTALANIPLTIAFVVIIISTAGRPYSKVVETLSSPFVAIVLLLMILSITVHMRIGMQVVIEDYIHGVLKSVLLIASTFFSIAVGLVSAFAVLKLAFGG